ncbi:proline-rich protein PRCC isoform X2 [Lacerta agilis]|uniref:proline-rich protein PRCC isoform X2 n=1 Tax=Lacerta agilis TaxID=80427 RepID=UPI0014196ABF|nr:proline-rich protein PRCC isoform X2 [Lacerta agilis]
MSLVAYASSEEEEQEESDAAEEGGGTDGDDDDDDEATEEQERSRELGRRGGGDHGLFSALPPPKAGAGFASQQQHHRPLTAGLPLPFAPRQIPASSPPPLLAPAAAASERAPGKKRTQPVRIAAPHLGDSDSEEDEPAKKHPSLQAQSEGSGLSALLPQPKNLTVKETNRLLLPYAFSRKAAAAVESPPEAKPAKGPPPSSKPKPPLKAPSAVTTTTTPSPSAIKAAAKSAALQVTKQITQEENDSDEEVAPENYFSLSDRSDVPALSPEAYAYPGPVVPDDLPPGTEPDPEPESQDAAANAPLEFKTGPGASSASHGWAPKPGEDYGGQHYALYPGRSDAGGPSPYYQDYYSSSYYSDTDPELGPPQEMSSEGASSSFMDDEAFKRLQGKRNRGREEINFVEIKGDDQLSGAQQWLTKSLTEEQNMKSFSKKKGEQPTGQQRRKHQITYLIHQAKERELELKNTWAENKLSRRQTQAKYGF